jgi:hypothetical protein
MKKVTYRKYDPKTWVEGGRLSEQFAPKPEIAEEDIVPISENTVDKGSARQKKADEASRAQMIANGYDPDDMGMAGDDNYISPRVQALMENRSEDDGDNGDPISGMMK